MISSDVLVFGRSGSRQLLQYSHCHGFLDLLHRDYRRLPGCPWLLPQLLFLLGPRGEKGDTAVASGSLTPQEIGVVEDKTAAFFPWNLRTRKEDSCCKTHDCEPLIIYTPFFGAESQTFQLSPMAAFFLQNLQAEKERQSDRTLKFIRCNKKTSKIKAVQDLIATSTMLLDLTWFGNVLYCKDVSDLRILGLVVKVGG